MAKSYSIEDFKRDMVNFLKPYCDGKNVNAYHDEVGNYFGHTLVHTNLPGVVRNMMAVTNVDFSKKNVKNGATPLMHACDLGNLEIVKMLCNRPEVNVNQTSSLEPNVHQTQCILTALHLACAKGHLDVVKYLVEEAKADINLASRDRNVTPLMYTVYGEEKTPTSKIIEVIDYLASQPGIKFSTQNHWGRTFLSEAVANGAYDIVTHICKNVFSNNVPRFIGVNALHFAIICGQMYMVQYFVEEIGVNVNDDSENTAPLCVWP